MTAGVSEAKAQAPVKTHACEVRGAVASAPWNQLLVSLDYFYPPRTAWVVVAFHRADNGQETSIRRCQ